MIRIWDDVSPDSPLEEQPTIGLIGMGAMGRMYAKYLSEAGWKKCLSNYSYNPCP
jgi:prephenate dehydrogenase